jgi:hypothetical protein
VLRLGEIIETRPVFFARYYHTTEDGMRKQKAVKLCDRSDLCRSKANVQPLMDRWIGLWSRLMPASVKSGIAISSNTSAHLHT